MSVERSAPKSVRWLFAVLLLAACGEQSRVTAVPVDSSDTSVRIGSVRVDPATVSATVGDSGGFTAVVRDRYGRIVTGAAVTWSSSNSAVVSIDANGFARAHAAGNVNITASSGGKSGLSAVTITGPAVTAAPVVASVEISPASVSRYVYDTAQFTAVARDSAGAVIEGKSVSWTSSSPSVATINAAGMGWSAGVGSAQVLGTIDGVSGSATLTVLAWPVETPAPVKSVTIAPGSVGVSTGSNAQLAVTLRDSVGNVLSDRVVSWTSSNAQVAAVSNGRVTGVAAGTASITATSEGVSSTSSVTVTPVAPAAVASVSIAPSGISLNTGSTTQLAATLRDANGNVLTGRSVSWSSSNSLVASVSNNGAVTGLVAGSATITATSEGVFGSANASVTLLPPPPTGGSWPNMPSGYSVLTEQAFNPLQAVNWELIWNSGGNGTITTDLNSPMSSGSVFQVRYPAGFPGGTAPATQWTPLGGRRNVFVGMWWKPSANWQGHASNVNKIQFVLPTEGGDLYMTAYGPPGGPYQLRVCLQFLNGDTRAWLVPNVSSGTVELGQWHRIEWLMEAGTNGANGVVKWWLDGQLVGNYTDVLFPAGGLIEYKLSPTWGGMGDSKQQTDYFWFDHVTISSR
jgi:uncharacterized protein YjdB